MSDQNKLKDILNEIIIKSDNVSTKAGSIQKNTNFLKEFAEVSIEDFDKSPLADYPGRFLNDFNTILKDLGKIEHHIDTMSSGASGLTFGTANAMLTLSGVSTNYTYRSNSSYDNFYLQFDELLDRSNSKDQVVLAIRQLGLDSIKEGNKAIELLNSAWEVHLQGVGVAPSSLIPIREAIALTLIAIQKKSPQSKIKKWIMDIGKKVAYSRISTTELQNLQNEHEIIRDQLSGSKSGTYSREEERRLLREGTLHLLKILNMIDGNKLI